MTDELEFNAFTGTHAVVSALDPSFKKWAGGKIDVPPKNLLGAPKLVDNRNWLSPDVGWGVVLPRPPNVPSEKLATADDAPEPLRKLLSYRGNGPVFRHEAGVPLGKIRRYLPDGSPRDLAIAGSKRGVGPDAIPKYLLIYGSPKAIPWSVQYQLGVSTFVGRLDLEGDDLKNYVACALTEWDNSRSRVDRSVVWAVDHGGDITSLMNRVVAKPLFEALSGNESIKALFIDDDKDLATGARLVEALTDMSPGFVVTTSHGMTGPLNAPTQMAAQLGLPVDSKKAVVRPADVLATWSPDGAIWYSHACCSAGSNDATSFAGLIPSASQAAQVFQAIAACGALVAPLPRALLGAPRPLRAFIGHVEPTTDWSLRQNETGQILTDSIVDAFYRHLYQPEPIGYSFDVCRQQASQLHAIHAQALSVFNDSPNASGLDSMLATRLMAVDRECMVILGDPAAVLPPLP